MYRDFFFVNMENINGKIDRIINEEINNFCKHNTLIRENNFASFLHSMGKIFAPNLTNSLEGLSKIGDSFGRMRTTAGKEALAIKYQYETQYKKISNNRTLTLQQRKEAFQELDEKLGEEYREAMSYLYPNGKSYGKSYGAGGYSSFNSGNQYVRQQLLNWDGSNDIQRFLATYNEYYRQNAKEVQSIKYFFQWCQKYNMKVDNQSYTQWLKALQKSK